METAKLVQLPSQNGRPPTVRVEANRLVVDHLVLDDHALAAFVADRPAEERALLVERALRVGLTAIASVGVTVNVDAVRAEFQGLLRQTEAANERAATALDQMLRQNFADGEGRLPRTLEKFLGDKGQLRGFVDELFDEGKRDSAIGRMKVLLGSYFDGDASKLAQLLDPTRLGSPLHQFRVEMAEGFNRIGERLAALEAAGAARAGERAKGSAKGVDFEETVDDVLGGIARGSGDLLERTGTGTGATIASKKGDFVLTLNAEATAGHELRIVIECKDRYVSGRAMRDELREAKSNRDAAVAVVVFTPAHAPAGIAPFDVRAGDVYCVLDPVSPDPATLEAAVRLARLLALQTLRDRDVEVDAAAVAEALKGIREQLETLRALKMTLTSIGTSAKDVYAGLDRLRDGILARITEAEAELRRR
ncbi:MAG TPA: hypothetical protein VFC12_04510 [Terriglobales bacterium]|nr:hypothetical protein [Terriglobales bacterium]